MPDRIPHEGDIAQIRIIAESIATSISETIAARLQVKVEENIQVPGPIKWAAGIIAALITTGIVGLAIWMVSTLNDLQITVARIDERQRSQVDDATGRFAGLETRVSRLEEYHRVIAK